MGAKTSKTAGGLEDEAGTGLDLSDLSHISNAEELFFEVSRHTRWQQFEVRRLYVRFMELCDRDPNPPKKGKAERKQSLEEHSKDLVLDTEAYTSSLLTLDPHAGFSKEAFFQRFLDDSWVSEYPSWAASCFCLFDSNNSGRVEFGEFVTIIERCCGKKDVQLQLLFDLFSADNKKMSSREFEQFLIIALDYVKPLRKASAASKTPGSDWWLAERARLFASVGLAAPEKPLVPSRRPQSIRKSNPLPTTSDGSSSTETGSDPWWDMADLSDDDGYNAGEAIVEESDTDLSLESQNSVVEDKKTKKKPSGDSKGLDSAAFARWAGSNVQYRQFMRRFHLLLSRRQEGVYIASLLKQHGKLVAGDVWFLVSHHWWSSWVDYVDLPDPAVGKAAAAAAAAKAGVGGVGAAGTIGRSSSKSGKRTNRRESMVSSRPITIDNSDLQGDTGFDGELRPGLEENRDFVAIPMLVWRVIQQWYGGGPAYPRKVVEHGGSLRVEFYPLYLTLRLCDASGEPVPDSDTQMCVSGSTTLAQCYKIALSQLELGEQDIRLWVKEGSSWRLLGKGNHLMAAESAESSAGTPVRKKSDPVPRERMSLVELEVETGDSILAETCVGKGKQAEWPMDQRMKSGSKGWTNFSIGDMLDAADNMRKWYRSKVIEISKSENKMLVHFQGWSSKWDEWVDMSKVCTCKEDVRCTCDGHIAPLDTQSRFWPQRQEKGVRGQTRSSNIARSKGKARDMSGKGVTGLVNLGNTCYMNSMLQCLSNTPICSSFFTSERYVKDINKSNPLGHKGKIATAFAALLKELWSGDYEAVAPRALKKAIANAAPQFAGYQQHDSQELLAFLLDGLHEDLNRVKKKPYIEQKDSDGRSDVVMAAEAWENHLRRNKSVVVDLFMGQLKSTVVCPESKCNNVSVTFDPFMFLPVPLPINNDRLLRITVVFSDGSQPPTMYGVRLPKAADVEQLLSALEDLSGVRSEELALCDVHQSKIFRVLPVTKGISAIHSEDTIIAYVETISLIPPPPPPPTAEEKKKKKKKREDEDTVFYIQAVHKWVTADSKGRRKLAGRFALPILLAINENVSNNAIHETVLGYVKSWLKRLPADQFKGVSMKSVEESMDVIYSTHANLDRCGRCGKIIGSTCAGCALPRDNARCGLSDKHALIVLWDGVGVNADNVKAFDQACAITSAVRHESLKVEAQKKGGISLTDCLEHFSREETLGKMDAWYCPKCKEHRRATKKLDMFRLPEVLIIQLKRFYQINAMRREKLDVYVDFPVTKLDLSHVLKAAGSDSSHTEETAPVYDLFAVSNHMGGTGGGHYTAYCKNSVSNKWFLFDDSRTKEVSVSAIKTSSAYVLFYRRRH